jgi:acyl-CoA thioesterase-1
MGAMRTLWTLMMMAALGAAAGGGAWSVPIRAQGVNPSAPPADPAAAALKIVAFGDSLTSGHRLPRGDAYPAVLERALRDAGLPSTVVNHGVSGDTTSGGVRRLEAALAENPRILIVAFGANDGLRGVPVAQVRANLERIVETATARGARVLLVGMEALPLYGWQYTVDFHNVFPAVAAQYDVPLVPFMLDGVLGDPKLMGPDGIHPNAAGARAIAANILTALRPLAQSLIATTN